MRDSGRDCDAVARVQRRDAVRDRGRLRRRDLSPQLCVDRGAIAGVLEDRERDAIERNPASMPNAEVAKARATHACDGQRVRRIDSAIGANERVACGVCECGEKGAVCAAEFARRESDFDAHVHSQEIENSPLVRLRSHTTEMVKPTPSTME